MKDKKGAFHYIHIVLTFLILGAVIWLILAEAKRLKANKEIANEQQTAKPPVVTEGGE